MDQEKSAAFNSFTADWKNRIETLMRTIILICTGVMSLTIGAFLSSSPPNLPEEAITSIRWAWLLLAVSLSSALLVSFVLVISGAIVLKKWERKVTIEEGRIIIDSPRWVHIAGWIFGSTAVAGCLSGLAFLAFGARCLLK